MPTSALRSILTLRWRAQFSGSPLEAHRVLFRLPSRTDEIRPRLGVMGSGDSAVVNGEIADGDGLEAEVLD